MIERTSPDAPSSRKVLQHPFGKRQGQHFGHQVPTSLGISLPQVIEELLHFLPTEEFSGVVRIRWLRVGRHHGRGIDDRVAHRA